MKALLLLKFKWNLPTHFYPRVHRQKFIEKYLMPSWTKCLDLMALKNRHTTYVWINEWLYILKTTIYFSTFWRSMYVLGFDKKAYRRCCVLWYPYSCTYIHTYLSRIYFLRTRAAAKKSMTRLKRTPKTGVTEFQLRHPNNRPSKRRQNWLKMSTEWQKMSTKLTENVDKID
jgi:hypothetical protein